MACGIVRPIRWSLKDTAGTVRQVKEHNAAYDSLGCPKSPTNHSEK